MRHQAKTQGFWGWVVLGLCALAVLAGCIGSVLQRALGVAAVALKESLTPSLRHCLQTDSVYLAIVVPP